MTTASQTHPTQTPPSDPCPSWCDKDHDGRPWHFGAIGTSLPAASVFETVFLTLGDGEASVGIGDATYTEAQAP